MTRMEEQKRSQLVKGALLLTLAGLVSKVLSAGYRIPLQNLTGDVGFYIYQQVYPFLGMALMLALYGFPQAISKLIVEMGKQGKALSFTGFYIPIFAILFIINGIFFLLLNLGGESLANWIGDANLASTYQFASVLFLIIPFTSLIRGVFQGNLYMVPTAISQVGEQCIRVLLIIIAALLVANQAMELYEIGKFAVVATLFGMITAIIILILFFISKRPIIRQIEPIAWGQYVKTILILGVVAAFNHMTLLVIQLADSLTMVPSLEQFGMMKREAMEVKGVFDRGQPLIQIGAVLGSSFALALIPTISSKELQTRRSESYFYIRSGLLFSFYLAFAATVGLIVIFQDVNILLYKDDQGTFALMILVLSIILSSIIITVSSILQGLGYIIRTAVYIVLTFFIKSIFNILFIPLYGITGASISTVLSLLCLLIFVSIDLRRKLPKLYFIKSIRWRTLCISSLAMVLYLLLMNQLVTAPSSRIQLLFYVLFIVVTGACIFLYGLLKGRAFTEKQLSLLPFANVLLRLNKGGKKSWRK